LDLLRISGTLEEQAKHCPKSKGKSTMGSRKPYVIHRLLKGKN
jgi:hypothetical protein